MKPSDLIIEKPNWNEHECCYAALDKWFDETIGPINKLLSEAVEVYGDKTDDAWLDYEFDDCTRKAFVICIQPIETDSFEKLVMDLATGHYPLVKGAECETMLDWFADRAKKLVEGK